MSKKFNIKTIDPKPVRVRTPGYFYHWCCDCGLRHIVVVEQHKTDVVIAFARDDYATMLERREKKRKKKRSKK